MKFYSNLLGKFYDTQEECLAEEKEYEKLTATKENPQTTVDNLTKNDSSTK